VIRQGLSGDETLVIQGLLKARPDMEVQTVEGSIEMVEDGLPHDYKPVPKDQWISPTPDPVPHAEAAGEKQFDPKSLVNNAQRLSA